MKKVLIIEDEAEMCFLLELLLNEKETRVEHVKSIAAAKEFLRHDQPSVILLDNRLPDGYGMEFLVYLKSNYPDIKIIMISGMDREAEDAAIENGADLFMNKPFTREHLTQALSSLTS
ncbi:MAG: response regulator [Bacteroidetes bacterium]|nr:response regulator [Bacteroidota bacterium]